MKLIKKYFSPARLPLISLTLGILGCLLRFWQEFKCVDEHGLYLQAHITRWLIPLIAALSLLLLALPIFSIRETGSYRKRFPRSLPAALSYWASAVVILVYGIHKLLQGFTALGLLLTVITIPAFLSLLLLGLLRFQGGRPASLLHGIVSIYFMVFAACHYNGWSGEPQLIRFIYSAFAITSLMLTAYYRATLDGKRNRWRLYTYLDQCALIFCLLALPGKEGWFYLPFVFWTALNTPILRGQRQAQPSFTPLKLPETVQKSLRLLEKAGYEAYVTGDCVRELLMEQVPTVYDLTTSAKTAEICDVFESQNPDRANETHGTVTVAFPDVTCRISTFRAGGAYSDRITGENPVFAASLEEDLKHRDFTVNAIAYSPKKGFVDPWIGRQDLKNKQLRTPAEPEARFREDPMRLLRGIHLCARYQFTPTEDTLRAMSACGSLLASVPQPRIFEALSAYLPCSTAENLLQFKTVLGHAIPELGACINFAQYSPRHRYDIYTHTAHVVSKVSQDLTMRWAALLHDVGKPAAFCLDENGQGHFRNHARISAQLAEEILRRMKAPEALLEQVLFLTAQHMSLPEPNQAFLNKWSASLGADRAASLLDLQEADFHASGTGETTDYFTTVRTLLAVPTTLTAKDLKVNGRDILALGVEPGPLVGECMCYLLSQVKEGAIPNTREALLDIAETFLQSLCTDPELFDSMLKEEEE